MSQTIAKHDDSEEEILSCQIADEALEGAAAMVGDRAGALTLAFCSGLDTCPGVRS